MNIAYILPSLVNQGPGIVVQSLVKNLNNKANKITVFYFDDKYGLTLNCNLVKIDFDHPFDFDKFDIIHSHCLRPDKYVIKWRSKIKKAIIVTTIHQDTFRSFNYQYNYLFSKICTYYWFSLQKKFNGITTISKQLLNTYNHYFNNRLTLIYNGCDINNDNFHIIDPQISTSISNLRKSKFKIIGVYAFITKRKGLIQVLKALITLKTYAFVIIGEGPELINLKNFVNKNSLNNRVLFFPYIVNPYNYLFLFDIYIMPSYSEGFGLSMVEAALAQKSIVCSNIDSFHEIFTSQEVSFFDLDNIESLKMAINESFSNSKIKGRRAFIKANSKFRSSIMANNYLKYYNSLLNI